MKILFKKYDKKYNRELYAWTKLYDNVEQLLKEMEEKKNGLLGTGYYVVIEEIA